MRGSPPWTQGLPWEVVVVRAIDGDMAEVENHIGKLRQVPVSLQRAKGGVPEVGERWVIDRALGYWSFAAIMSANVSPLPLGLLGIATATANHTGITGETDLPGLTVTVTITAGRRLRLTGHGGFQSSVTDDQVLGRIKEGATNLAVWCRRAVVGFRPEVSMGIGFVTPTAGNHTYRMTLQRENGTGTVDQIVSATNPAWLTVEDVGAA